MTADAIDICIIQDDPNQLALMVRQLERHHFRVASSGTAEDGLRLIRQHHPSVVISDLVLPDFDGIELCRRLRADQSLDGIYIIVVTACNDRETKHTALSIGADDYLIKPYDAAELIARLRNGFRVTRLQERLRRAALIDGLTGLWNHTQFRQLGEQEFARVRRYGGVASLLLLDLDLFKAINDTYGHEAGNHVLKATASHLLSMVRDTDVVARYGGEEFAVICPETEMDAAAALAERIRQTLRRDVAFPQGLRSVVTASIGVASTSLADVVSVRDWVNLADQALYAAKRSGRDRVCRADQIGPLTQVLSDDGRAVDRLEKQVIALNWQTRELCLQSVWALVQALEARDCYTAWHSRNTRFYVTCLAERAGWPESLRTAVGTAAMLHDLGKIGISDSILLKPGPLNDDEAQVMRGVASLTCQILEPLRIFETETSIIRHLRERYDGTGYPDHLRGADIPIGSRLLAVAETFDALTSERPHRQRRSLDEAVAEIRKGAGGQFDPEFVEILVKTLADQRGRWQAQIDRTQAEGLVEVGAPL